MRSHYNGSFLGPYLRKHILESRRLKLQSDRLTIEHNYDKQLPWPGFPSRFRSVHNHVIRTSPADTDGATHL